jgi:hypothetical protein
VIFWIKLLCLCVLLAGAETLHGIARIMIVVPRIGKRRANQYGVITGTILAFVVCYTMVPGLGIHGTRGLILVGTALSVFMAAFDIILARSLAKRDWMAIADDFKLEKGNFLILGLAALIAIPYAVMRLRG